MAARSFLSAYVLIGVIHVVGVVTSNSDASSLTGPLLMPLLLAYLIAEGRRHWCRTFSLVGLGVGLAWIGGLLITAGSDLAFALGIAASGATGLLYAAAFRSVPGVRYRRDIIIPSEPDPPGLVRRHKWLISIFAGSYVVLMAALLPAAGLLILPIALYGVVIWIMAMSALNLVQRMPAISAWLTFAGAITLVASNSLLTLVWFDRVADSPMTSALVTCTYIVGQGLLVVGVVAGTRDNAEVLGTRAVIDSAD